MPLKRALTTLGLGVLALSGACDAPVGHRAGTKSTAPSAGEPPRAVMGARLVRMGEALLLARGSDVWRVPLPLGAAPAERHALPGPVGEIAVVGDAVWATLPGLFVRLDAAFAIAERVAIAGAGGFAVTGDGKTAVVTSAGGAVVGVDLTQMREAWRLSVGPHPRRVVLGTGEAWVSHAVGVTHIDGIDGERTATPMHEQALDPSIIPGVAIAYGTLPGPAAQVVALAPGSRPKPLPAHARAVTAPALIATDAEILVLDAELGVAARRPTAVGGAPCPDPRGVAADAHLAYVACADGAVVAVPLSGDTSAGRLALEPRAAVDCEGVEKGPVAEEARSTFGDADRIHAWLRRYHCTHPHLTDLVQFGETHQGRPLMALVIGNAPRLGHDKPTFLINGAHHGSELMSSTFALDTIDKLLENRHPAVPRWLREDVVFVVVPLVNPDGNMAYLLGKGLGRKNGRDNDENGERGHAEGVDLNRNYPFQWHALGEMASSSKSHSRYYRGPSAGSEPETQAMMRLAESERFAASISFHTGTLALLAPYTIPQVKNPTPNEAWTVAEEIAKQMIGHPEGLVPVRQNLYPVDGTDQDWFRHQHGTLALLVEGAKAWQVEPRKKDEILRAVRYAWTKLVDRYLDGAAVGGRVRDAVGRPLEAEVAFAEIHRPEKERWTSRCRDGRFDRYLSKAGDYTLVVTHGDVVVKTAVAVSAKKRALTDVTLPVLITEPAVCPTLFGGEAKAATVLRVSDAN